MKKLNEHINNSGFENIYDIGVKKLKNFGFINVTKENILDDEVYRFFFTRFVSSLRGKNIEWDDQIDRFIHITEKENETGKR